MAYILPNFNLLCGVYTNKEPPSIVPFPGTFDATLVRITNQECALVFGRRVCQYSTSNAAYNIFPFVYLMSLLTPPLTDLRGWESTQGNDFVEVPQGSGRFYIVNTVDDIGKGYPNEHRTAALTPFPANITPPML
jgi:hypothetical protein